MFIHLLKDKYIKRVFILDLIVLGVILLIVIGKFFFLEDSIILHYDIFKGVDFLGSKGDLYGILAANIFFVFIDLMLADFLYDRERFFSYILVFGSLMLEAMLLISLIILSFVN